MGKGELFSEFLCFKGQMSAAKIKNQQSHASLALQTIWMLSKQVRCLLQL